MHVQIHVYCEQEKNKTFFFALALDVSQYLVGNSSFDIYKTERVEKGACELCAIITKRTCHFLTFNSC